MKKHQYSILWLMFFARSICAFGEDRVEHQRSWSVKSLHSWVVAGDIFQVDVQVFPSVESTVCVYRGNATGDLLLAGGLAEISKVVNCELSKVDGVFLKEKFPQFFTLASGRSGCRLLDPISLRAREHAAADNETVLAILRPFCAPAKLRTQGAAWEVEFHVLDGGIKVEKWSLRGRLDSFMIDSFSAEQVHLPTNFSLSPVKGG